MAFDSLSDFLNRLDAIELLKRIPVEVDPEYEVTEIVNRLYTQSLQPPYRQVPALLFEKVKGSRFPLAINTLGSDNAIELLLGNKPENIGREIFEIATELPVALQQKRLLSWLWSRRSFFWKAKSAGTTLLATAPCKEVKKESAAVNLNELPILKCWPLDGGKFITAGLVFTKSPKTGIRNVGIYRLQVLAKNELGLHWQIQKGGGFHYAEAEEMDQPLEVAVVIGADPMLWLAGILPLPEGMDELAFAGFLRKAPVPMIRCETIDLEVPASAEFVIEGIARPERRSMEGPFGDHFGHYSHAAPFPVLEIQCITHKTNAIYHAAVVGKPPQEDRAMGETVSKVFQPLVRLTKPELVDLWAYYEAGFHNLLVASAKQRYAKEGIKTALGLLGEGQLSLSKCVILVDPEVNVRDFKAVLQEIRKNFDSKEDFILLPRTAQDTLDFTGPQMNLGSKMILDATTNSRGAAGIAPVPEKELSQIHGLIQSMDGVNAVRIVEGALLAVQVRKGFEGRMVLENLLQNKQAQKFKLLAVVSEDVPLEDEVLLIWGIFTRFDCSRDVLFAEQKLEGVRPVYTGALGIDATWKSNYPKPVEMPVEVVERVSQRWKEYGLWSA